MPLEPPPPYEVALGHPQFTVNTQSTSRTDPVILPPTVPPGGIEVLGTQSESESNPKFRNNGSVILQIPQLPIRTTRQIPNNGRYYVNRNELVEPLTEEQRSRTTNYCIAIVLSLIMLTVLWLFRS